MSSGAWYEMRRKAAPAGVAPSEFDKTAGKPGRYARVKAIVQAKREASRVKAAGGDTQRAVNRIKETVDDLVDFFPDIDVGWGTP
jgi:hypothetical protein